MLKIALSNGYSSQVRGWLVVGGVQHELAQVGPDFCILRQPIPGDFVVTDDIQAGLLIEVDGDCMVNYIPRMTESQRQLGRHRARPFDKL